MSYYSNHKIYDLEIAGKKYTFDFGKYATLTNGSCVVTCGGTSVLATAVMSQTARDIDYMPLMVNYQEKLYAAGMIKGSRFLKRETRPSDDKILISRVIDRSIRPLFPNNLRNDVQIMLTTLSYDRDNEHDICAALGASAALHVSNIPWGGPIAMLRVGIDTETNNLVLNPSFEERKVQDLDLIVSSTKDGVVMLEAGAKEINEEKMLEAIEFGQKEGAKICTFFEELRADRGQEKIVLAEPENDEELNTWVKSECFDAYQNALWTIPGKLQRVAAKSVITENAKAKALESGGFDEERLNKNFQKSADLVWKNILRTAILEDEKRIAGRKLEEIRSIYVEKNMLERTHGSALFQRGETQALSIVTLAPPSQGQIVEGIEGEETHHYFHHYNFPPYSVGSCSHRVMTGNREIGHGALAERALLPVLPSQEEFGYTIRVVSEILMSNGSSSMAATCGSTLALMAAGVPIKRPVSGIAMGLITSEDGSNYKILSDIQDDEDFVGDMDFKITGTTEGITAIQMDIKLKKIDLEVFKQALSQSKEGRAHILAEMLKVVPVVSENLSKYAPKILTVQISTDLIGKVIGRGGEIIQKLTEDSGCEININDDGLVTVASVGEDDMEILEKTVEIIKMLAFEPKVGETYNATIARVEAYGAFVDITSNVGGLVHVSKIADERIENVSDILSVGDTVRVKLTEVDSKGRLNLSIKDADTE
ncbi:TPA: polyribonucleotide nucleotidyltransferase [Candidatus Gracilibacteria bacterium]|nr:polyribonucleotide nucleotidyltransferase [Candidatus Peregrinibacteria bacterium]HIQ56769.1 polyribonucleotide nucleotidyltransferase [Candidatus Gracilibacteria bacterium]HIQ57277.1 polyribonucleotide nucleotidyltransferase [Candidatus Gracilibacteria bacterium]